jgi:hypothetical protein
MRGFFGVRSGEPGRKKKQIPPLRCGMTNRVCRSGFKNGGEKGAFSMRRRVKQNRPPVGERRWCPLARDLYDPGHRVLVVVKSLDPREELSKGIFRGKTRLSEGCANIEPVGR